MAITRIWQAGAELAGTGLFEFTSRDNTITNIASNTKARTGTYAFRASSSAGWRLSLDAAIDQWRMGMHVNHAGGGAAAYRTFVSFNSGSTNVICVRWNYATGELEIVRNAGTGGGSAGTLLASVAIGALASEDTWFNLGVDCLLDSVAGWVNVYVDGTLALAFAGDNTGSGSSINGVVVGSGSLSGSWSNYIYFDDLFLDNTADEAAPAPVPDYRFQYITPAGNGNSSSWAGSDGNSTDNYALVDELPPNEDTDYVVASAADIKDSYTLTDLTALPVGWTVKAVIPVVVARKTDGAIDTQIALGSRLSATEDIEASQALGTGYAMRWARQTERPGGGQWTEANVNAAEVIIQSAGAF